MHIFEFIIAFISFYFRFYSKHYLCKTNTVFYIANASHNFLKYIRKTMDQFYNGIV